ncbi:hypothetical protein RI367_004994 [Sorochytrium milnesiophthora]
MSLKRRHSGDTALIATAAAATAAISSASAAARPSIALEEDVYTEALSHIIQRDFFPDLKRLRVESDYVRALERADAEQLALAKGRLEQLDAAEAGQTQDAADGDGDQLQDYLSAQELALPLDAFQAKFTSEDNASFASIMDDINKQKREKLNWMYNDHRPQQLRIEPCASPKPLLALPNADCRSAVVPAWDHKAQNALMFAPDGVREEQSARNASKRKETVYSATRFHEPTPLRKLAMEMAAATAQQQVSRAAWAEPRNSSSALPENTSDDPRVVRGFALVPSTPTPHASTIELPPMMTWGEIESTPIAVRDSDDMATPTFNIPEHSRREQLGTTLSNNAKRSLRKRGSRGVGAMTPATVAATPSSVRSNASSIATTAASGRLGSKSSGVRLSEQGQALLDRTTKANASTGDSMLRSTYSAAAAQRRGGVGSSATPVGWSTRSTMSAFSFTPTKRAEAK